MPPISIHALVGLLIASKVANSKYKVALVFGAVLPDVDLLASVGIYLLTGDMNLAKMFHRTISHSLFVHLLVLLTGWGAMQFGKKPQGVLLVLLAIGMIVHTSMDFVYPAYMTHEDVQNDVEPGVAIFWPFTDSKYAIWEIEVSDKIYSILIATDFLSDPVLYFLPLLWLASKRGTDVQLQKPLTIISISDFLIMTGFTLLAIVGSLSPNDFIFFSYIPGIVDVILAVSFPLLIKETVGSIDFGEPWMSSSWDF
ncbi:MAG: metal-dependent hydrolase [Candidatus Heimdallarchaeota archaeon]